MILLSWTRLIRTLVGIVLLSVMVPLFSFITLVPSLTPSLTLKDVLDVLGLTKNLISISKLTSDFLFSITFTNDHFNIQNQVTRKEVETGQCDNGLYVLKRGY